MTKIAMCDICLTRHDKFTRATNFRKSKKIKRLRLDMCNVHTFEVTKKFPKISPEYVQFVYKMAYLTEITLEQAELIIIGKLV